MKDQILTGYPFIQVSIKIKFDSKIVPEEEKLSSSGKLEANELNEIKGKIEFPKERVNKVIGLWCRWIKFFTINTT